MRTPPIVLRIASAAVGAVGWAIEIEGAPPLLDNEFKRFRSLNCSERPTIEE
ncbi:MAG: hypothetical protein WBC91_03210 [Phototrophicaceae bacterium]